MSLAQIQETELPEGLMPPILRLWTRETGEVSAISEPERLSRLGEFVPTVTPCWHFRAGTVVLESTKPVCVRLEKGQSMFFAENEALGIYATGETQDEAIRDFCGHVVHFYEHYKRLERSRAIGEALRLKDIYEDLFKEP